jgi:hypothetical protein
MCCLLECRGHHFTGTTPVGPEIDHYRQLIATDIAIKMRAIKFKRCAGKQEIATFTTLGLFGKPGFGDPINGKTMRADKFNHDDSSLTT